MLLFTSTVTSRSPVATCAIARRTARTGPATERAPSRVMKKPTTNPAPASATVDTASCVSVPWSVMNVPTPAARMPRRGIAVPIAQLNMVLEVTPAWWRSGSGSCSSARAMTGREMRSASRKVSAAVVSPPPTTVSRILGMSVGSMMPSTRVNPTAAIAHRVPWMIVRRRGALSVRRTSRGVGTRSSMSQRS